MVTLNGLKTHWRIIKKKKQNLRKKHSYAKKMLKSVKETNFNGSKCYPNFWFSAGVGNMGQGVYPPMDEKISKIHPENFG